MTTARYYTPSGRSIQVSGIEPDIELEYAPLPEKEEEEIPHYLREEDLDNHMVNENSETEEGPVEIDTPLPAKKEQEKGVPGKNKEDLKDDEIKEDNVSDIEESKDLDTLYKERLARDNQIRMAVQVLKSWSVIQHIKPGGTADTAQAN